MTEVLGGVKKVGQEAKAVGRQALLEASHAAISVREEVSRKVDIRARLAELSSIVQAGDIEAKDKQKLLQRFAVEAKSRGVPVGVLESHLRSLGVGVTRAPEGLTRGSLGGRLRSFGLSAGNHEWGEVRRIAEDLPTDFRTRESVEAIRSRVGQFSGDVVFRMMSEAEFTSAVAKGAVGGEVVSGQLESGTTWWADGLTVPVDLKLDKKRAGGGKTWGGGFDRGVLVVVRKEGIDGRIIESSAGNFKTKGPVSIDNVEGVFRLSRSAKKDALGSRDLVIEELVFK